MAPAIAIDLGTSYCSVAVWRKGKVEIITNDLGEKFTPSYVAFTDTERLIGDAAKSQSTRFDDPIVQSCMKQWPFKVVEEYGMPKIEIGFPDEKKMYNPEQIISMILTKMKEIAENYLKQRVEDAVITVPASFNDSQRRATKKAAEISGLNVLRIVNEPTVAALAYGLNRNDETEKNILIFDLGGGKLDVSVLGIKGSFFQVKATSGNSHLGGEDFDTRLVDYLCKEFENIHQQNLDSNPAALMRLKDVAEKTKCTLSIKKEAPVYIDRLLENIDFETKITRKTFKELCDDLFKSTLEPAKKALDDAELDKHEIDDVVLVGGSTHSPKIRKMLRRIVFSGKRLNLGLKLGLNLSIDPKEVVVYGAAVYAAILSKEGNENSSLHDVQLIDVAPYSLGVECSGGEMENIINRNDILPCNKSQTFTTDQDNQQIVTIQVFEGEHAMTEDNSLLGRFELSDIAPAPRGVPRIDITFDMDANGFLHVIAKDTASGRSSELTWSDEDRQSSYRVNYPIRPC